MSLYSLAKAAAAKAQAPTAAARVAPPAEAQAPAAAPPPADGAHDNKLTNAANALAKYIPKEVVTLYVAGVAAGPALKSVLRFGSRTWLYWGFVAATPLLFLLVFLSFLQANGKPIPSPKNLPWWPTLASAVAFAVWALAVPGNPYVTGPLQAAAAGFFSLVISTLLSLLDPWLDPPKR